MVSKNTLYITFDGLSDPLGQSQILPYICGIASQGFHITILSCEKNSRIIKEEQNIRRVIAGFPISWQFILYNENGGIISRVMYVRKLSRLANEVRRKKQLSLVHCRSYLASLIGLRLKTVHGIPFVFDMRGFWADERIDGQIWSLKNPVHRLFFRFFKKKEKQFILNADAVVSLTVAGAKELSKKFRAELIEKKTEIIPCCTNTTMFDKNNLSTAPEIQFDKDDHLLVYTGSIGTWYYTKEMIDCVLVWKKEIPRLKLLIITKDLQELELILSKYSVEERRLVLTASAEYRDVPKYLKFAKAAIFFIKPSYSKIASSPTKMAECWSMDLPIITNSGIGDNDLYFKNNLGGIQIQSFDTASYSRACKEYLSIKKAPGQYRDIALQFFDTKMAITKYTAIYQKLIGQTDQMEKSSLKK